MKQMLVKKAKLIIGAIILVIGFKILFSVAFTPVPYCLDYACLNGIIQQLYEFLISIVLILLGVVIITA